MKIYDIARSSTLPSHALSRCSEFRRLPMTWRDIFARTCRIILWAIVKEFSDERELGELEPPVDVHCRIQPVEVHDIHRVSNCSNKTTRIKEGWTKQGVRNWGVEPNRGFATEGLNQTGGLQLKWGNNRGFATEGLNKTGGLQLRGWTKRGLQLRGWTKRGLQLRGLNKTEGLQLKGWTKQGVCNWGVEQTGGFQLRGLNKTGGLQQRGWKNRGFATEGLNKTGGFATEGLNKTGVCHWGVEQIKGLQLRSWTKQGFATEGLHTPWVYNWGVEQNRGFATEGMNKTGACNWGVEQNGGLQLKG